MLIPLIKIDLSWHVLLLVCLPTALIMGCMLYTFTPEKQASDMAWEKQYNNLSTKISHMDCSQLQKIRLDSIAGKPFDASYGEHWGQIRDTYNALSCGNHWGIWED
jgi:hypothetical protein